MLGFFAAVSKVVSKDEWISAVSDSVPDGTEELNLKAFNAGWDWYEEEYGGGKKSTPAAEAEAVEESARETVATE
jgi:Pyruvate/2-oxoacid:ferredoxin oxidoreductase gamma subunit